MGRPRFLTYCYQKLKPFNYNRLTALSHDANLPALNKRAARVLGARYVCHPRHLAPPIEETGFCSSTVLIPDNFLLTCPALRIAVLNSSRHLRRTYDIELRPIRLYGHGNGPVKVRA